MTALELHAHSVHYAHKLTARRALEKTSCSHSFSLERGTASHPADPHYLSFPLVKETQDTCVGGVG